MGSRLRKLKNKSKGANLCEGRPVGGKNRLTDAVIDQIQTYYGLAIRRNIDNVDKMKQAVWAVYYHKISTDASPHHGLCPKNNNQLFDFGKFTLGVNTKGPFITKEKYTHKNSLPVPVMEAIKPCLLYTSRCV